MKTQATMIAVGALSTLVMIVPSFAQGGGHAKHHPRAGAVQAYPNYYNRLPDRIAIAPIATTAAFPEQ